MTSNTAKKFLDWDACPLGVVADGVIAQRMGCTRNTVRYQRERRGIAKPPAPPRVGLSRRVYVLLSNCEPWTVRQLCDATGAAAARVRSLIADLIARGIAKKRSSAEPAAYELAGVTADCQPFRVFVAPAVSAAEAHDPHFDVSDPVAEPGTCQLIEYDSEDRSDAFHCKRKRQQVTIAHCTELFTEVHAYRKQGAVCLGCEQGAINRLRHCYEVTPDPALVSDLLDTAMDERKRQGAEGRLLLAMERGKNEHAASRHMAGNAARRCM